MTTPPNPAFLGVLRGAGEWDPPGGWRDFTLALATGDILSGA